MPDYKTITEEDSEFPPGLRHVESVVKQIYVRGSINNKPRVAIVGSRRFTPYGKFAAEEIATFLAEQGVSVVSGLALGLDSIAHQAVLDAGGHTVAVLPCGIDKTYPASHRKLAEEIIHTGGAIISEYPPGVPPLKHRYPERNRIVSGLCDAVIVVEAAHKSGSLITSRLAIEQGKEVFAVPGPINSPMSEGTNTLLQAGAHVITKPEDVVNVLGLKLRDPNELKQHEFTSETEEELYTFLKNAGPAVGEEIQIKLGIDSRQYLQAITMLEIRGYIYSHGGDRWSAK